jgi:hypothetical protein
VLLLAALLGPRVARADPKFFVDLEYEPDAALTGCPSEPEFKTLIGDQVGYDPFRTGAEQRLVVRAHAAEHGLRGVLEWYDVSGAPRGERELRSENTDCAALARAMGFAVAVQIQLLAQEAQASSPPPSTEASSDARGPTTSPPAPPSRAGDAGQLPSESPNGASAKWQFLFGAGPTLAFGLAPRTLVQGRIFGGIRHGSLLLELGGEASLPSRYQTSEGNGFEQRVFAGSLSGCVSFERLSPCLVSKVGRLSVTGFGVDAPNSDSGPLVQLGPRLSIDQAFGANWFGALRLEALATLMSWEVTLNQTEIWKTPLLSLSLGGDIGLLFP